jgi:hypothetical protein
MLDPPGLGGQNTTSYLVISVAVLTPYGLAAAALGKALSTVHQILPFPPLLVYLPFASPSSFFLHKKKDKRPVFFCCSIRSLGGHISNRLA